MYYKMLFPARKSEQYVLSSSTGVFHPRSFFFGVTFISPDL
jgi:hypothetical protein